MNAILIKGAEKIGRKLAEIAAVSFAGAAGALIAERLIAARYGAHGGGAEPHPEDLPAEPYHEVSLDDLLGVPPQGSTPPQVVISPQGCNNITITLNQSSNNEAPLTPQIIVDPSEGEEEDY